MATALEKAHRFATDPAIVGPLTAALVRAAIDIAAEDPATEHHVERAAMAVRIIQAPSSFVQQFAWVVSSNETVVNAWAEGDQDGAFGSLQYVTNSVFNAVAGIVTEAPEEPEEPEA